MDNRDSGKKAEGIVGRACDHLAETWTEVAGHITSRLLDSGGVDRLIILKSGFAFALQVKTSERGVREHRQHPDRPWYRYIPVIIISPQEIDRLFANSNIQGVAARIKQIILEAYVSVKNSSLPR